MVQQNAKKIGLRFQARVQTDQYRSLFARRLAGEKLYINKAMEHQFTRLAESTDEKEIGDLITKWHEAQVPEIQKQIFAQKKRLADAERKLLIKQTKKALNDQRIATKKIAKLKNDLEWHQNQELEGESDERIFPYHYMSMLCLNKNGEKVVVAARYLLRPANKDESFDRKFGGCYNARLDNLDKVPWWKSALGKRHGLIMVSKFYENVPSEKYRMHHRLPKEFEKRENIVLCFQPDNVEYMFIPTLWDYWQKGTAAGMLSAALITDEPAPEIAKAGHDRTPIFLKESAVDAWLTAKESQVQDLKYVLDQREHPHYSHRLLGGVA